LSAVPQAGNAYCFESDAAQLRRTARCVSTVACAGWTHSSHRLHAEEKIYTFWVNAHAFQRNAGFRMDFLLLSEGLAPRLAEANVDAGFRGRDRASDHAPTWIKLS